MAGHAESVENTGMLIARIVIVVSLLALSACQECEVTNCGSRSVTYCVKQGKDCSECRNHKLTDENGETLSGCEDGYENGKIVSCEPFMERDIADYCGSGGVCTGLNGNCQNNGDCCTGFCGAEKHCATLP